MYQISDRTLRYYREHLRKNKSFTMELKTDSGPVEIYVDGGGYATIRNPESRKFNLSIGTAAQVIALIESGEPLPVPTSLDFTQPLPENLGPAIELLVAPVESAPTVFNVDVQIADTGVKSEGNEATRERKQRAPRAYLGDVPNARKVIAAALSGVASLRAKRDVLRTLPDGSREWRFSRRRRDSDGKWKVEWSEVVAIFTPTGEFTLPQSEQPVVLNRQSILRLQRPKKE